ncbi:hypothetical protein SK128_004928, partial [Halocaridina rubra]
GAWATFIVALMGVFLHVCYYAVCHPGPASLTKKGLECCPSNRQDFEESDYEDDNYDNKYSNPA